MQAIILCGGFGTRLREVVQDVPKPMAPINGTPFLKLVVDRLVEFGFNRIVLAVGYKREVIEDFFKDNYKGVEIIYSIEDKPLLTGGAIKQALNHITENNVFILNGDNWLDIDYNSMMQQHLESQCWATLAIKPMQNFDRFGNVIIDENNNILEFKEKEFTPQGNVNLGVYIVRKDIYDNLNLGDVFSHVFDYLIPYVKKRKHCAFNYDGYWIDIGILQDYTSFVEYAKKLNLK